MIDVLDRKDCTGCALCADICPKGAISMVSDATTGFKYPVINRESCIGCNLCEKKCPSLSLVPKNKNIIKAVAANNKNIETRFESTSGGVFTLLANYYYKKNGVVVGAIWANKYEVVEIASEDKNDLPKLQLSKYTQSDSQGIYSKVREFLKAGRDVLFVGLPCQIAAIKSLCPAEEKLVTVDLVCKGVPAPMIWRKYIDSIEHNTSKTIERHRSKDKEYGWKRLGVRIDFKDSTVDYHSGAEDTFIRLYSKNIIMRDSCYQCKYRGLSRLGDLTLGDCWGIQKLSPKLDDNCGSSMIFINTEKGGALYFQISDGVNSSEFNPSEINRYNRGISDNFAVNEHWRSNFWKDADTLSFEDLVEKYDPKRVRSKWKQNLLTCYDVLYRLKSISRFHIRPIYQFFKYNFFSKHFIRHNGAFFYPSTYCNFMFEKGAVIELFGDFTFGNARMKNSSRESRILMRRDSKIVVRKRCAISEGADIEMHKGSLWTMDIFYANFNLEISCGAHIDMRDDVGAGRKVTIRDYNGHLIAKNGFEISSPIIIENHTWLCSGCTIMPGVHIGTGAIVSANAYVASNVPPYTLMAGKPAVIMGKEVMHQI